MIHIKSGFVLEKHLEEFLERNWESTDLGKHYDLIERQYETEVGPIDLLAVKKDRKEFMVIELKKGRTSDLAVGQIQRYMGYIKDEIAEDNQEVQQQPEAQPEQEAPVQEEASEDSNAVEEQETDLHQIIVNGEKIEVDLEELKAGYQKDADYRRKTEEIAIEKRELNWLPFDLQCRLSLRKQSTLVYQIEVHARLLILRKKSPLHGLILACTFIDFKKKFPTARLFGSH